MSNKHKPKSKKKKDTFGERILTFLGVILFFLPFPVYILFTDFLFPAPNSGFLCLGYLGCAVISLAIIVALVELLHGRRSDPNGYKMILLVLSLLGIGAVLIVISAVVMYLPSAYRAFNQDYVMFYFVMWALLLTPGLIYLGFRTAVNLYLKGNGHGKTAIKTKMKGKRNYWWYEELHQSYHLGWIYYLNKIFTVLYMGEVALHFGFGWWKFASPVIAFGISLLSFMNIPMWGLIMATEYLAPKVGKNKSLGFGGVFGMLFSAASGVAVLMCFFQYVSF